MGFNSGFKGLKKTVVKTRYDFCKKKLYIESIVWASSGDMALHRGKGGLISYFSDCNLSFHLTNKLCMATIIKEE